MVLLFKEITILGDTFGQSLDNKSRVTKSATRSFFIRIDNSIDRSIDEIYSLLPKLAEVHPYQSKCFVSDIQIKNTDNPHDYQAEVSYKTNDSEDDLNGSSEEGVEFPWDEPAVITMSSDTSQTEAVELAYTKWPFTTKDQNPSEVVQSPKQERTFPAFPILNEPLHEQFSSVPEEPIACRSMNISFALRGYEIGENRKKHDRNIINFLQAEYFTVNNTRVTLFGYGFDPYCGYVAEISVEDKFFKSKRNKAYAYYDVSIRVLDNPNTWVRRILNMSFNTWVVKDDKTFKSHISIMDGESGKKEKVKEPQLIHPHDAAVIGLFSDGSVNSDDTRCYVLPFLTKKPSGWISLQSLCNKVDAR